jgi:hypothetical protein
MAENNFVDYVKIFCRSGKGGAGSAHFRREKYIPKGGPDGGDGGRGGHVILKGNAQMWTLLHLKYRKHVFAGHGEPGRVNAQAAQMAKTSSWKFHSGPLPATAKPANFCLKLPKTAKPKSWYAEAAADWEMSISNRQLTKRPCMPNPAKITKKLDDPGTENPGRR